MSNKMEKTCNEKSISQKSHVQHLNDNTNFIIGSADSKRYELTSLEPKSSKANNPNVINPGTSKQSIAVCESEGFLQPFCEALDLVACSRDIVNHQPEKLEPQEAFGLLVNEEKYDLVSTEIEIETDKDADTKRYESTSPELKSLKANNPNVINLGTPKQSIAVCESEDFLQPFCEVLELVACGREIVKHKSESLEPQEAFGLLVNEEKDDLVSTEIEIEADKDAAIKNKNIELKKIMPFVEKHRSILLKEKTIENLYTLMEEAKYLFDFLNVLKNGPDSTETNKSDSDKNKQIKKALLSIPPIEILDFGLLDNDFNKIWDDSIIFLKKFSCDTQKLIFRNKQRSPNITIENLKTYWKCVDTLRKGLNMLQKKLDRRWKNPDIRDVMNTIQESLSKLINNFDNNLRVEMFSIKVVCEQKRKSHPTNKSDFTTTAADSAAITNDQDSTAAANAPDSGVVVNDPDSETTVNFPESFHVVNHSNFTSTDNPDFSPPVNELDFLYVSDSDSASVSESDSQSLGDIDSKAAAADPDFTATDPNFPATVIYPDSTDTPASYLDPTAAENYPDSTSSHPDSFEKAESYSDSFDKVASDPCFTAYARDPDSAVSASDPDSTVSSNYPDSPAFATDLNSSAFTSDLDSTVAVRDLDSTSTESNLDSSEVPSNLDSADAAIASNLDSTCNSKDPDSPSSANDPDSPSSANDPDSPSSANDPDSPSAANDPDSAAAASDLGSSTAANYPDSSAAPNYPDSSVVANYPNSSAAANYPDSSAATNYPDSSAAAN